MGKKRSTRSAQSKAQIALEAASGKKTLSELAGEHAVHPTQISQWKTQLLEGAAGLFERGRERRATKDAERDEELLKLVGELKLEVEWYKKKLKLCPSRFV